MKQLDIVIPVRDEAKTIGELVERIAQTFAKTDITYTCIFVDDNSQDGTLELLTKLKKKYPLTILKKKGKTGKAYSVIEGALAATTPYIAVIDADLQYPPEALPELFAATQTAGVVVGKRAFGQTKKIRTLMSKAARFFLGKQLFGFDYDVLSGIKVFKRDIIEHIDERVISAWTLDIPLIDAALELGHAITEVEIPFIDRPRGTSKHNPLLDTFDVLYHALFYKLKNRQPVEIAPQATATMTGAGLIYNRTRYITHTTLNHTQSALETISRLQRSIIVGVLVLLVLGVTFFAYPTALLVVGTLSFLYFVEVLFNLFLILKSLHQPPEISISKTQLAKLSDAELPTYTILCPLYKEAHVLPHFLKSIGALDWPHTKLDVVLLLEEDDTTTIAAAKAMKLPSYVRILVVPDSLPKTKPKACNYGLAHARGEYLVIYDAEDMPASDQLKKVYAAFQSLPGNIKCIQAKLNYYNPHQNLLTRFFTAEYSLWFDVILTGLQTIQTTIPLGGTSNHFRTKDLVDLQGWDPFNVTEDCDLGIRLFKRGARTAVIDSVTLEEANSDWKNWLRQRSRWIKGYMQTYLLHMRHPFDLIRSQGIHALIFQLTIGGKIGFLLINPFMWILTLSYFFLYAIVGPTIESLYPAPIFYMAVVSLVFGNFMFMYYYMIGIAKRGHWTIMKFVFLVPLYWLLASIAAFIALYQLIVKPHYWEKTIHGLHLKKEELEETIAKKHGKTVASSIAETLEEETKTEYEQKEHNWLIHLITKNRVYLSGLLLIFGSVGSNFLNFVFNAIMGRSLPLAEFGTLGLVSSLYYLAMIPFGALSATITYQTGYLDKRYGRKVAYTFWQQVRNQSWKVSTALTVLWLTATPFLMNFFNTGTALPFLLFAPVLFFGVPLSLDRGLMAGILSFEAVGLLLIVEAVVKLVLAWVLTKLHWEPWIHSVIFASTISALIVSTAWVKYALKRDKVTVESQSKQLAFPRRFFSMSMLSGLSLMTFLSLDVLLVKHYLPATTAGEYNLIALIGKMIFFGGTIASQFVIPLVSRNVGAKEDSTKTLNLTLLATFVLTSMGFVLFGLLAPYTAPLLFGEKIVPLVPYIAPFAFGMMCFVLAKVFVQYYLARQMYLFAVVSFLIAVLQIVGLSIFHSTLELVVYTMMAIGVINFVVMVLLHKNLAVTVSIQTNTDALTSLLFRNGFSKKPLAKEKLKILFFNWRDTKHVWAGGAEVYVHEIAKKLVADGHKVTVFCGNDGHDPRNEVVDGVQVVRRGGFYTVYIWAFLYYVLRFKGLFDVVVDCENGVPFFTPLFVEKPKALLIHHIHQEVFRTHLPFPLGLVAEVIETKIMPVVYKNQPIITVSESSQKEIERIGLGGKNKVTIVNCGISDTIPPQLNNYKKTEYPSFLYLGRLKPYKNVDVAIKAFSKVLKKQPNAIFTIAGDGESRDSLIALTKELKLTSNIHFVGKVSDNKKHELYAASWVALQPSEMEGWGITVIEANAHRTPVIASNTAGLRDSVVDGTSGILVSPRNTEELSKAMIDLVSNHTKRSKLSSNALAWSKQFSWHKSAQAFLACIRTEVFQTTAPALVRKK